MIYDPFYKRVVYIRLDNKPENTLYYRIVKRCRVFSLKPKKDSTTYNLTKQEGALLQTLIQPFKIILEIQSAKQCSTSLMEGVEHCEGVIIQPSLKCSRTLGFSPFINSIQHTKKTFIRRR